MDRLGFVLTICIIVSVAGIYLYNSITAFYLNQYAKDAERSYDGIMKGAEPIFLRSDRTKKAALLIHGFIGSPTDFGRLPELLNKQGYTVFVPLLPGHGTDPRDFSRTTSGELEAFVLNEYRNIKKNYAEVTLIGFSMGGALSVLTAAKERVDKLVLLAPYFKISHQWYYLLPTEFYQKLFMNIIPYTYRPLAFKQINNKAAIPDIIDYDFVSLKGADAAIRLGKKALAEFNKMKQPTLIIHANHDKATDYATSKQVADSLNGNMHCEFITLKNTNHIIMKDYDSEIAEEAIVDFLSKDIKNFIKGGSHARMPKMP